MKVSAGLPLNPPAIPRLILPAVTAAAEFPMSSELHNRPTGICFPRERLSPASPAYPANLLRWNPAAPGDLACIGSSLVLRGPVLGLVCSKRIPGRLLVEVYEWAQRMKLRDAVVAGGFHSPMERECLHAIWV